MRKINTRKFRVATRATAHEVNRQIVLNLIREHQPISRAELARRMNVRRAALTGLVRELISQDEIMETGTAASARGRRPTLLRIQTNNWMAIVADVRVTQTTIMLTDFGGTPGERELFATMRHQEMAAVAELQPSTPTDMYRMLAAQETVDRREALLRGLRQRGAMVIETSPEGLAGGLVDRYLAIKERGMV